MNNETVPQHGAQQIAAEYERSIERLKEIRDIVLKAGGALDGWHCCPLPSLSTLLQLHRAARNDADAKPAARALAKTWERSGDAWQADMLEMPGWKIILHGAETENPKPKTFEP